MTMRTFSWGLMACFILSLPETQKWARASTPADEIRQLEIELADFKQQRTKKTDFYNQQFDKINARIVELAGTAASNLANNAWNAAGAWWGGKDLELANQAGMSKDEVEKKSAELKKLMERAAELQQQRERSLADVNRNIARIEKDLAGAQGKPPPPTPATTEGNPSTPPDPMPEFTPETTSQPASGATTEPVPPGAGPAESPTLTYIETPVLLPPEKRKIWIAAMKNAIAEWAEDAAHYQAGYNSEMAALKVLTALEDVAKKKASEILAALPGIKSQCSQVTAEKTKSHSQYSALKARVDKASGAAKSMADMLSSAHERLNSATGKKDCAAAAQQYALARAVVKSLAGIASEVRAEVARISGLAAKVAKARADLTRAEGGRTELEAIEQQAKSVGKTIWVSDPNDDVYDSSTSSLDGDMDNIRDAIRSAKRSGSMLPEELADVEAAWDRIPYPKRPISDTVAFNLKKERMNAIQSAVASVAAPLTDAGYAVANAETDLPNASGLLEQIEQELALAEFSLDAANNEDFQTALQQCYDRFMSTNAPPVATTTNAPPTPTASTTSSNTPPTTTTTPPAGTSPLSTAELGAGGGDSNGVRAVSFTCPNCGYSWGGTMAPPIPTIVQCPKCGSGGKPHDHGPAVSGNNSPPAGGTLNTFVGNTQQQQANTAGQAQQNMGAQTQLTQSSNAGSGDTADAAATGDTAGGAAGATAASTASTVAQGNSTLSAGNVLGSAVLTGVGQGITTAAQTLGTQVGQQITTNIWNNPGTPPAIPGHGTKPPPSGGGTPSKPTGGTPPGGTPPPATPPATPPPAQPAAPPEDSCYAKKVWDKQWPDGDVTKEADCHCKVQGDWHRSMFRWFESTCPKCGGPWGSAPAAPGPATSAPSSSTVKGSGGWAQTTSTNRALAMCGL